MPKVTQLVSYRSSWDSNSYLSSAEEQAFLATLKLALTLGSSQLSGRDNIYYEALFFFFFLPFSVANPPISYCLLCWATNSMQQQSRRTNAKSRSRDQKNLSFTSYAERRSGASTTSDNTGRGPERLQTAPRSQVLVKAHVPAKARGAEKVTVS